MSKCPKCNGCGKLTAANPEVTDSATKFKAIIGKPWSQFSGQPYESEALRGPREGAVVPAVCDACGATGEAPEKPAAPAVDTAR